MERQCQVNIKLRGTRADGSGRGGGHAGRRRHKAGGRWKTTPGNWGLPQMYRDVPGSNVWLSCRGELVHVQGFVQPRAHGGGRRTGCWHTACITSACTGLEERV